MPKLKVSAVIKAPPEKVFEYVTAFGKDGPIDEQAFQERNGKVQSREESVFLTQEEEGPGKDRLINWRCTFNYPTLRVKEARDSLWADRIDYFEPVNGGTRWSVEWRSKMGFITALVQFIIFKLRAQKIYRSQILQPTIDHFHGKSDEA